MTVKTTGAELKRFYLDDSCWPGDSYAEGEEMIVDGEEWDWTRDIESVSDSAVVRIAGGIVHLAGVDGGNKPSVESHFKRWQKRQNTALILCEAPKDRAAGVEAAIIAAGGKVK